VAATRIASSVEAAGLPVLSLALLQAASTRVRRLVIKDERSITKVYQLKRTW
jgi:hypothetical protein